MSKPTPGPWRPVRDAQGVCGLMHPTKHGTAVAWFSSVHSPANGYVGEDTLEIGRPEREANALLIAAATDLLEACKIVKAFIDGLEAGTEDDDPLQDLRRMIHAPLRAKLEPAIAKAEGRH